MAHLDQAKSLCILKGALGPVFDSQKTSLLDNFVAEYQGRLVEAAPFLSEFSSIGFLSPDEIPPLLSRLNGSPSSSSSSSSSSVSSSPSWEQLSLRETSPIDSQFFSAFSAKENSGAADSSFSVALEGLEKGLREYGVETLSDVIQLKRQDEAFSVIENVLPSSSSQGLFQRLCDRLLALPCFDRSYPSSSSSSSSSSASSSSSSAFYVCGQDTQLMVVDNGERQNTFCLVEKGSDGEGDGDSNAGTNDVILFYLDTSSSMNSDENGRYLPPHSLDHPASSIKKARDLIPPLVRGAVKRGNSFLPSFLLLSWSSFIFSPLFFFFSFFFFLFSFFFFSHRRISFRDSLEHHPWPLS